VPWKLFPERLSAAVQWAQPPEDLRGKGAGFSFDPDYAPFLQAVRGATPENAAISIVAPRTHEYYTYQAAFTLAPRRVAWPGAVSVAGFVAYYKDDRGLSSPGSSRIPHGVLVRR
jgi:hypothetical protein